MLDLCQSTEEIVAILNEGETEDDEAAEQATEQAVQQSKESKLHSLARVKLALKYEQKRVGC